MLRAAPAFRFLDVGPLIERELELVAPHPVYIDDMVRVANHPASVADPATDRLNRQQLLEFFRAAPRGRQPASPEPSPSGFGDDDGIGEAPPASGGSSVPVYYFWMRLNLGPAAAAASIEPEPPANRRWSWSRLCEAIQGKPALAVPRRPPINLMAGRISLRVGNTPDIEQYFGHIGYNVYPPARGHHYAERACRLLLPLARKHGMRALWITCNPDNHASRRTCERLGGEMVDIVDLPMSNILYQRGERQKCRYRVDL